ncbi:Thermonuclease precursor [compost metagenome]
MKAVVLISLGLILVAGPLSALALAHDKAQSPKPRTTIADFKPRESFSAVCTEVEEADLIRLKPDGRDPEEAYLIGSDTPEPGQGSWTDRTRQVTKALILNKRIKVVLDQQPRANCGRLRAYVYAPDGTFLNLRLIEQGYASVLSKGPNLLHDAEFKKAEQAAKLQGLGIWAAKDGLAVLPGAYRKQHGNHQGRSDQSGHTCQTTPSPAPNP